MSDDKKHISPEDALLNAIGPYLESIGWRAIVVGVDRIQQGGPKFVYELVIKFTGSEMSKEEQP